MPLLLLVRSLVEGFVSHSLKLVRKWCCEQREKKLQWVLPSRTVVVLAEQF